MTHMKRFAVYFAPVLPRPFTIEDPCLLGEDAAGRFQSSAPSGADRQKGCRKTGDPVLGRAVVQDGFGLDALGQAEHSTGEAGHDVAFTPTRKPCGKNGVGLGDSDHAQTGTQLSCKGQGRAAAVEDDIALPSSWVLGCHSPGHALPSAARTRPGRGGARSHRARHPRSPRHQIWVVRVMTRRTSRRSGRAAMVPRISMPLPALDGPTTAKIMPLLSG